MACINPLTLTSGEVVPCGRCNLCLQLQRMDWCWRLGEEQRVSRSSHFLTLTYDDANLPAAEFATVPVDGDSSRFAFYHPLVKKDLQDFTKRLRTFHDRKYDGLMPLRYYSVGEYGEKFGRPHYHSIMFNMIPEAVDALPKIWGKGNVHVGQVTGASIGYVTSYCINRWSYPGRVAPFLLCQRSRGLARTT